MCYYINMKTTLAQEIRDMVEGLNQFAQIEVARSAAKKVFVENTPDATIMVIAYCDGSALVLVARDGDDYSWVLA